MKDHVIRIIITDDYPIIAESLKRIFDLVEDIEVVAVCNNGKEALKAVAVHKPDMVLLDAVMPVMNGVEATKRIKEAFEKTTVLMLTTFSEKDLIVRAFEAGVDGYILKDITSAKLIESIRDAASGDFIIPGEVAAKLVKEIVAREADERPEFNDTEIAIIDLLKKGLSNKEISEKLDISYGTTRNYVSDIYKKTGENNRRKVIKKLFNYKL